MDWVPSPSFVHTPTTTHTPKSPLKTLREWTRWVGGVLLLSHTPTPSSSLFPLSFPCLFSQGSSAWHMKTTKQQQKIRNLFSMSQGHTMEKSKWWLVCQCCQWTTKSCAAGWFTSSTPSRLLSTETACLAGLPRTLELPDLCFLSASLKGAWCSKQKIPQISSHSHLTR